ncbi:MAG: hypothetical protein V3T59_08705 [Desulfobacterales bacterium]
MPLETSKVIVFAKITFRFKECMKRLSSEVQTLVNRNIFMTTGIMLIKKERIVK